MALRRRIHARTDTWPRVGRGAAWLARSATSALGKARHTGHRFRYLPLAMAAVGAVMVTLGPQPRLAATDVLSDNSMLPGLAPGESLTIDRRAFVSSRPRIGEIVTFHPPAGEICAHGPYPGEACQFVAHTHEAGEGIKRVVAGPGDRVAIHGGRLVRQGRLADEPYDGLPCVQTTICDLPRPVTLPPGTWWLLADNRNAPTDSRRYGPIPTSWITGLVRSACHPACQASKLPR